MCVILVLMLIQIHETIAEHGAIVLMMPAMQMSIGLVTPETEQTHAWIQDGLMQAILMMCQTII